MQKNKKISIFINDISCSGGTERVASFLANSFSLLGYDVALISLTLNKQEPYYHLNESVTCQVVGSTSQYALAKFLKNHCCDILISISMGRLSFQLSIIHFLLRHKSKIILSEHVAYETSPCWIRALKRLSYHLADELVLLTQHDQSILDGKEKSSWRLVVSPIKKHLIVYCISGLLSTIKRGGSCVSSEMERIATSCKRLSMIMYLLTQFPCSPRPRTLTLSMPMRAFWR